VRGTEIGRHVHGVMWAAGKNNDKTSMHETADADSASEDRWIERRSGRHICQAMQSWPQHEPNAHNPACAVTAAHRANSRNSDVHGF
jgi:hypothetical protein